jgi:hypothetical protein
MAAVEVEGGTEVGTNHEMTAEEHVAVEARTDEDTGSVEDSAVETAIPVGTAAPPIVVPPAPDAVNLIRHCEIVQRGANTRRISDGHGFDAVRERTRTYNRGSGCNRQKQLAHVLTP